MSYQLRILSLYSGPLTLGGVNPMSEALGSGAILTGVIWGLQTEWCVVSRGGSALRDERPQAGYHLSHDEDDLCAWP